MSRYVFTARRRAALRKARLASARKRRGKKLSRRGRVAVGVLGAGAIYLTGREIKGTNTYRKYRSKVTNVTTRKRVGYRTVVDKKQQSFNRYASRVMGRAYDDPPEYTGSIFNIPIYRRQFRTRQNRKMVFSQINGLYRGMPRTTFKSRRKDRKVKRKLKKQGY